MSCDITIPDVDVKNSDLNVSDKYLQLMRDSVADDSLYIRAKDTMKVIFDNLQIDESEKAKLVAQYVSQISIQLSSVAMQTAVMWSKEERDGGYALAKAKAEAEMAIANAAKTKEEICLVQKQAELVCAQITATISGTFRENGEPSGYEEDGCKPTGLKDEGLKYHQTKLVEGNTYQVYADAYRKSGIVKVGIDTTDNQVKGLAGNNDPISGGYTNQQTLNAERQRLAYEDSKRTHAANSAATMIGQLLSSETLSDTNKQDIERWRRALDYLNHSDPSTPTS